MTKAQILKKEILSQYRSVRQFAMDMQIPYSTLVTGAGERHRWHGIWYRNQNVQ